MLADSRRSDEEFPGLGGISGRRTKGRWRRASEAFYSRDGALIRRGLNGINGRRNGGLGRVSDEIFGPRRKTMTWPWQVGPTRQRGREKESVPFRDTGWTVGLFWYWAERLSPGPFSYFLLFSFLLFLFLFYYFFYF
jgi:hypothetical protein